MRIDPNGMLDGDFYDKNLTKIGTDDKLDGQNYVVTNAFLRSKVGAGLHNNKTITGNNYVLAPKNNTVSVYSHKDFTTTGSRPNFTQYDLTKF